MMNTRLIRLLLVSFALSVAACSSGSVPSASAPPSAGGGPVTTEEEAVARVIEREPRLAGIAKRDPAMIGQSSWYEVAPASGVGAFIVTVRVGWGDCQAGCIDEHTWVYAIGPDGSVTLQSEGGGEVPGNAWPSSGAAGGGGGGGATGIAITAVAGPTCPVETVPPDPECAPRPVQGVVVFVQDDQGNTVSKAPLDGSGMAFVELPAGAYIVTAEVPGGFMGPPEPQQALVEAGRSTAVTLTFDTGIR